MCSKFRRKVRPGLNGFYQQNVLKFFEPYRTILKSHELKMFFDLVKQHGCASMLRCVRTLFGYQNLPASLFQVLAFFADTSVKLM